VNIGRRVALGIKWTAIDSFFNRVFSLVVFLIIARILGPDDFGRVAIAIAIVGFVDILTGFGLNTAIIQGEELGRSRYDTAFTIASVTGMAGAAFLYIFSLPLEALFAQPHMGDLLQVLAIVPLLRSLGIVQVGKLSREMNFRALAARNMISTLVSGLVGVTFALLGFGVYSLVTMHVSMAFLELLLVVYLVGDCPRFRFASSDARQLLIFGRSIVAFEFVSQYNRRSPVLFAGYFLGSEIAGLLAVSLQVLSSMLAVFTQAFNRVAIPYFARLKNDQGQLLQVFQTFTRLAALIAAPVYVGFSIVSPEFCAVFLGAGWLEVAPVMQFVVLVGAVQSISYFNGGLLVALGRPDLRVRSVSLRALSGTVLFLLGQFFGVVGMVFAFLVRGVAAEPLQLYFIRKELPDFRLGVYFAGFVRFFIYSLIMAGAVLLVDASVLQRYGQQGAAGLFAQILLGAVVYLGLVFTLEKSCIRELKQTLSA
jgi:O-antigen/teichoic acid export membrane protein